MEKNEDFMITTIDNPYNPFEDFENWYLYDIEKGYFTCESLARLINEDKLFTDKQKDEETNRAIDRLIQIDPLAIYKKVYKNTEIEPETLKTYLGDAEKT